MDTKYAYAASITAIITIMLFSNTSLADSEFNTGSQPQYWYDGDRRQVLWESEDEIVIHADATSQKKSTISTPVLKAKIRQLLPDGEIIETNEAWSRVRLPQNHNAELKAKLIQEPDLRIGKVYYRSKQAGLNTRPLIETREIIVHFHSIDEPLQALKWGKRYELTLAQTLASEHTFLFHCDEADTCLQSANAAYQDSATRYAYPNWLRPRVTRQSDDFSANDPLLNQQWHLDNSGQNGGVAQADANVINAWSGGYGSHNEIIAIIDNGLDIRHEDLVANVIPGLSWDYVGRDNDPSGGRHGTKTAGVAAARGGNGIGISGTAPHAGLVGIKLLGARTDVNEAAALGLHANRIDIYSNSWGPSDVPHLEGPSPLTQSVLLNGIRNGRNGKGSVYVWAGGNGRNVRDNSNYDGYANSPYTIAVAASTNEGTQAWYSESGANLWVNAPSSGGTLKITTTNAITGITKTESNYLHDFGGTSSAAPLVSGVIALMLEQNPQLGWLDIQHILAHTAQQNDPNHSGWVHNGAGFPVSHQYGFGRVDAAAATELARRWVLLPEQKTLSAVATPNTPIPDAVASGAHSSITIEEQIAIDYVEVTFKSDHGRWGDLEITLMSPDGTSSVVAEPSTGRGAAYQDGWRFGVARLLNEASQGTWTLQVKDTATGHTGQIQQWSLKIHGRPETREITPNPVIEFGVAQIDHNWKTIAFKSTFVAPVVILGPPSFNGGQPGVVRMRQVTPVSVQIRIQEWEYLDKRHVTESVPYIVIESGRHVMPDGRIWEAGVFTQSGTGHYRHHTFNTAFAARPELFLSVQSYSGVQATTVRARGVDKAGYWCSLFEQEALMDGHVPETLAYLAISAMPSAGSVNLNGIATPYQTGTVSASHHWTPVLPGTQIKLEEERSANTEIAHVNETLSILSLNNRVFAQDISSRGSDTAALRVRNAAL